MCRHMYKGRGMYMCGMILAAIWVLVVSTLLSLVLFTLGSSVHIRSGGGGLSQTAAPAVAKWFWGGRGWARGGGGGGPGGAGCPPPGAQPGRHARCETEMFGPWTRYCKRRGKGGLKRRIMGRFFFAGCTRVGGRRDGRRRQAEDSRPQMGADCRAPLPSDSSCRPSKNSGPTARGLCGRTSAAFLSPPTDVWGPGAGAGSARAGGWAGGGGGGGFWGGCGGDL